MIQIYIGWLPLIVTVCLFILSWIFGGVITDNPLESGNALGGFTMFTGYLAFILSIIIYFWMAISWLFHHININL